MDREEVKTYQTLIIFCFPPMGYLLDTLLGTAFLEVLNLVPKLHTRFQKVTYNTIVLHYILTNT